MLTDKGGRAEVGTIRAAAIDDFATVEIMRRRVAEYVSAVGPMTAGARTRSATSLYLQLSARLERLAQIIGIERQAASVPSLDEALRLADDSASRGSES